MNNIEKYRDLTRQLKIFLDGYMTSDCPEAEKVRKQMNDIWGQLTNEQQWELSNWGIRYLCQ